MVKAYDIPTLPLELDLEDKAVLKQCNLANRQLAELKGLVHTIPNESILLNTLTLQEAKDSSEVENIVTTQDDLYKYELLDLPILYLSRYITQTKGEYYHLIQAIRDGGGRLEDWRSWILYMLRGIETTARHTIAIVNGIKILMADYKRVLRPAFGKVYRHEMLNHLFCQPYTKIEYMVEAMSIKRLTATKYLDKIVDLGLLNKVKVGRTNYYINQKLVDLFVNHEEIQS